MKWLPLNLWMLIILLLVCLSVTRAQSTIEPIKAKQRELTYQIQPDGSRSLKREEAGVFYRSSSGATMNTMGNRSTFLDEQGDAYDLVHSKKLAKLVVRQDPPELLYERTKRIPPENIQGYEMVNGFQCAIRPVLMNGKPAGKSYSYLPYGLIVKTEAIAPDGSFLILTVRELFDIEVVEPDPELVRIPEGYAINDQAEQ